MGFLIGIALLALFSAALLNPYGRRLLMVMGLVAVGGIVLLYVGLSAAADESARQTSAAPAFDVAASATPDAPQVAPVPPKETSAGTPAKRVAVAADPYAKYSRDPLAGKADNHPLPKEEDIDLTTGPGPFDDPSPSDAPPSSSPG